MRGWIVELSVTGDIGDGLGVFAGVFGSGDGDARAKGAVLRVTATSGHGTEGLEMRGRDEGGTLALVQASVLPQTQSHGRSTPAALYGDHNPPSTAYNIALIGTPTTPTTSAVNWSHGARNFLNSASGATRLLENGTCVRIGGPVWQIALRPPVGDERKVVDVDTGQVATLSGEAERRWIICPVWSFV